MNRELIVVLDSIGEAGRGLHKKICPTIIKQYCHGSGCRACPLAIWAYTRNIHINYVTLIINTNKAIRVSL